MTQEETDAAVALQTAEEADLKTANELKEVTDKLAKADELVRNYKIRAEKAEKLAKQNRTVVEPVEKDNSQAGLSSDDVYAFVAGKVPQEDIPEVRDYSVMKGISIQEALQTNFVKTLLSDKAEQRNVANAANTGGGKRGSGKLSDEALISEAQKGNMPESDADIERLYLIRRKNQ